MVDEMKRDAWISTCGKYRYSLRRVWDETKPEVCFILCNPSTADGQIDDMTIRKCIAFAKLWGFGRLVVINLFNYRATDPADLMKAADPVGPLNTGYILTYAGRAGKVVVGWGNPGSFRDRDIEVMEMLATKLKCKVYCLGTTKAGLPRHPSRLAYATELVEYEGRKK